MSLSLRSLQQRFASAVCAEGEAADLFTPAAGGGPALLDLYRHAYRIRLSAALGENYPLLQRVLGDEAFAALADGFITARPSRHPSIRWFGAELADYLAQDATRLPHPALLDLARMEWALGTAFDGLDGPLLRVDDLLQIPPSAWPDLCFEPHPTLKLLPLQWSVEPLWTTLSQDPDGEAEPPVPLTHHLLVWRQETRTQWRSLGEEEAALLKACSDGRPFAEWCAAAEQQHGEQAAAVVAGYLRGWVVAGMLASMRLE